MTGVEPENGLEEEILNREVAERRAREHRDSGQHDPFPEIPPSLLSAEHIKKYVMEIGAIAPFYIGGDRNSRLKKASYEGRIGERVYVYNKQGRLVSLEFGDELRVEANSIVFVECDLDFRLPDYIALRFNLQIRHVHRGLLLGTGPLVDPGYWGKLCIPLHNLTDEDYSISRDDGLIWVEFTKTTADPQGGNVLGRPPLGEEDGYWNIREFIERAASPRNGIGESVHIRSSISKVIDRADSASDRAESASSSAKQAERSATDAKDQASRMRSNITLVGIITGAVLAISIVGFIYAVFSSLTPRIDDLQSRFSYIESAPTDEELKSLPSVTRWLEKEIEVLHRRVEELEKFLADERKDVRQK